MCVRVSEIHKKYSETVTMEDVIPRLHQEFFGNMHQTLIWTSSVLGVLEQPKFSIFFFLCSQKFQQYESDLTELNAKSV